VILVIYGCFLVISGRDFNRNTMIYNNLYRLSAFPAGLLLENKNCNVLQYPPWIRQINAS